MVHRMKFDSAGFGRSGWSLLCCLRRGHLAASSRLTSVSRVIYSSDLGNCLLPDSARGQISVTDWRCLGEAVLSRQVIGLMLCVFLSEQFRFFFRVRETKRERRAKRSESGRRDDENWSSFIIMGGSWWLSSVRFNVGAAFKLMRRRGLGFGRQLANERIAFLSSTYHK